MDIFAGLVSQGRTVLLVTHDRDAAKRGSRRLTLSDGEIAPAGEPEAAHV
jgi:predicted ABC-type transport system involved in lysophospholipase L1 biosynthesis ATPase subunit